MPDVIMQSVQTKGVGFAPILKCYFERCNIQNIIDDNVPLDLGCPKHYISFAQDLAPLSEHNL